MSESKPKSTDYTARLDSERERIAGMGGEEALARQKAKQKLNVRERVGLLFDSGTFQEVGAFVDHAERDDMLAGREMPADGVVTGWGKVNGAHTYVIAYDFTVLGGSMGHHGERKAARIRAMAKEHPGNLVWLIDSAGARVGELGGSFFSTLGDLFFEQVRLSGICNQLCIVVGPGVAGTAYIPGLADCVIMTKKNAFLALAGPPLVEAAISEKVSEEELGGAHIHYYYSGLAHFLAEDDNHAIELGRKYLGFFHEPAPAGPDGKTGGQNGSIKAPDQKKLDTLLPEGAQEPFDVLEVVNTLADENSALPFQADYGASLQCVFARIGGFSAGVLANQSASFGGIITNEAAQKAARFIQICDKAGIPLLFLHDVPGFMVGSRVEKAGIIRDGAKFLFAMSNSRVPKISVVMRKSYGAGYFVMCGRGFQPDAIAAWPAAEIALMGAEGVVNIIHRKTIQKAEDPAKKREELLAAIREEISSFRAARFFGVDDIIHPRETRDFIIKNLQLTKSKAETIRESGENRWVFPV